MYLLNPQTCLANNVPSSTDEMGDVELAITRNGSNHQTWSREKFESPVRWHKATYEVTYFIKVDLLRTHILIVTEKH